MASGPGQIRPDRPWLVTSGAQDPDTVDRLLRLLPDWFGIESANAHYVAKAHDLPTYLAWPTPHLPVPDTAGHPVGVLLVARTDGGWRVLNPVD